MSFLSFLLMDRRDSSSSVSGKRYKPQRGQVTGGDSGGNGNAAAPATEDEMSRGGGCNYDDEFYDSDNESNSLCNDTMGEPDSESQQHASGAGQSKKGKSSVYTYMTREAIANRCIFLVAVGLLIIFFICVAR
jgi:hypothetical protein